MVQKETRGRKKKEVIVQQPTRGRGRPAKVVVQKEFDPSTINLVRGSELSFNDNLFIPMKTANVEIDDILSTEGGLMPATNMIIVGGPGSGKTTVSLDICSDLTAEGYKCLYVSGEMDEIGHYKYCKRLPKISKVQTLFLQNHEETVKEVLTHVFSEGYDVIVIDSIAEVIEMIKDNYKMKYGEAESWFLTLQKQNKKGNNKGQYHTSFINIQQVTKAGDFAGSNRLKHMTDAMCHVEVNRERTERTMHFSKNRDCDKDFKINFAIHGTGVQYAYEQIEE